MADKESTVRRGYQAFGEGDMEHFRAIYTPDVVQRMPGNNQMSGEHEGIDKVLGLYGKLFERSRWDLFGGAEECEDPGRQGRLRPPREGRT